MSAAWLIFACRTMYAPEVVEIIWRTGGSVAVLVDNLPDIQSSPLGRVVAPADLVEAELQLPAAIPLNTPGYRYKAAMQARAMGIRSFPTLIDPTSVVARTAQLGEGTMLNALTVIGANACLGRYVSVNRMVSVGHDAHVHSYVTLGPACALGGLVTVEAGVFVGAGAVLAPRVQIGKNAVVGAGAVVLEDVPERAVVVGNPARVIRIGSAGYEGGLVPGE